MWLLNYTWSLSSLMGVLCQVKERSELMLVSANAPAAVAYMHAAVNIWCTDV